jgi:hypothetical protein
MEDHESEIFREERNEIDEILLCQPEMLKHNLPVEVPLCHQRKILFLIKNLYMMILNMLILMIRKYILLLLVLNF